MNSSKLIALIVVALLYLPALTAQENAVDIKKNELKFNALNAIVFRTLEGSYEYLVDNESSFGISLLYNLEDENSTNNNDDNSYIEKFAITPYYRHFFSRKYAWGFFLEAFAMYNQQEDKYYNGLEDGYTLGKSNNFALGMSLGGKFVSKGGFAFEFYGGLGRNIAIGNEQYGTDLVPRLGASFGYRF